MDSPEAAPFVFQSASNLTSLSFPRIFYYNNSYSAAT
jgi:hypothetical protein